MNGLSKSLTKRLHKALLCRFLTITLAFVTVFGLFAPHEAQGQVQTASTPSIDMPVLGSTNPSQKYKRHVIKPTTKPNVFFPIKPNSPRSSATRLQNTSSFGLGWKPKPLVDTSPKPVPAAGSQAPVTATPKTDPAAEAFLRPMLPFISAVEENLQIHPSQQQSIQNRLNNLQTVLFGGVIYQDPAECLAKVAELYPQEAQKSRQQLLSDLQKKTLSPKNVFVNTPGSHNKTSIPSFPPRSDASTPTSRPAPAKTSKAKTFFSNSSWNDDPFKNDPFFNESVSANTNGQTPKQNALKSFGQGLANLAALAAPVAGSYYLNKSLGNSPANSQQLPNYSYPYGPYAYGPYGTNTNYNAPVINPAGLPLGTYYQDPYTGQLLPMAVTGTATPVIRSYPPYAYGNPYPQQSMITRFP